jgi:hypothetical protein
MSDPTVYRTITSRQKRFITTLRRRMAHLERRISESRTDLSYDKAELAALNWALSIADPYDVLSLDTKSTPGQALTPCRNP